jgi:hypothetical protein
MSNNTNTPAFLIILPILVPSILNACNIYHSILPQFITQYFHPLLLIGQYLPTPLTNPPFLTLPSTSLHFPPLPQSRPRATAKVPHRSTIQKRHIYPPSGGDFLIQQMGFSGLVHMAIVIRMLLNGADSPSSP